MELCIAKCNGKCPLCCNQEGNLPIEFYEEKARTQAISEEIKWLRKHLWLDDDTENRPIKSRLDKLKSLDKKA